MYHNIHLRCDPKACFATYPRYTQWCMNDDSERLGAEVTTNTVDPREREERDLRCMHESR